jgi:glycosyltransferase involved in cell wall biosynthesis
MQKALHVLKTQGLSVLISKLRTTANIKTSRTPGQLNKKPAQLTSENKVIFIGRILSKEKLKSKMTSAMAGSVVKIAFSHDNYLEIVGGVQLKIADEQLEVNRSGKGYLHIFPYGVSLALMEFTDDSVIGLNLNGEWVGYTHPQILNEYLSENSAEFKVEGISIHHVMGFDLRFFDKVIEATQYPKVVFWLHDFFSLCPGYLLLRNNLEFCGAPKVTSNACFLCLHGERRIGHLKEIERFFSKNTIEVISPSEFALDLWRKAFPVKDVKATVCPHAILEYQEPIPKISMNKVIKIAFVGFPVYHKGWETWLRLTERFGSNHRFEFFLFSETRRPSRIFKNISVSVTKESRNQMAEQLRNYNIDVAFLWSRCPETFSFTLYESLSAGCTILTNQNSGNIQAYVREHPESGLVLESEDALIALFEGGSLSEYLVEAQRDGRRSAKLIVNKTCQELF